MKHKKLRGTKAPAAYRPTTSAPLRMLENHMSLAVGYFASWLLTLAALITALFLESLVVGGAGTALGITQGLIMWRALVNAPPLNSAAQAQYDAFAAAYEQTAEKLAHRPDDWLSARRVLRAEHENLCRYLFAEHDALAAICRTRGIETPMEHLSFAKVRDQLRYSDEQRHAAQLSTARKAMQEAETLVASVREHAAKLPASSSPRSISAKEVADWEPSELDRVMNEIVNNGVIAQEMQAQWPAVPPELLKELEAHLQRNTH